MDPDRERNRRGVSIRRRGLGMEARARRYAEIIADRGDGGTIGLLVWGDPSDLHDSTIRIVALIENLALISTWPSSPGISSIQLLAAQAQDHPEPRWANPST